MAQDKTGSDVNVGDDVSLDGTVTAIADDGTLTLDCGNGVTVTAPSSVVYDEDSIESDDSSDDSADASTDSSTDASAPDVSASTDSPN